MVFLAACSSEPTRDASVRSKGGYYLDDGPGAHEPDNLDSLPDAQPRAEPINPFNARPYTVLGKTYIPFTKRSAYKVRGVASWYGKRYNGQRTSNGEIYDMYAMTAAHPILPLPSYARVTNLRNGKSVVVRINDRGPFHSDRLIDLSYAAAKRIGIIGVGSATVEVEALLVDQASTPSSAATDQAPAPSPAMTTRSEVPGHYVQLGAFSNATNADDFLQKIRLQLSWLGDGINTWSRDGLIRVHAGPYASREQANTQAERIQMELGIKPIIVTR
jgi:rare lipoprotein A